jgi:hypothetical protein
MGTKTDKKCKHLLNFPAIRLQELCQYNYDMGMAEINLWNEMTENGRTSPDIPNTTIN